MRFIALTAAATLGLLVSACAQAPNPRETGGRELRPPREGIKVGSLYYVREQATDDLTTPANLEDLCVFSLEGAGVAVEPPQRVADIDLLKKLDVSGELAGLEARFASAGLSGGLDRYFSYKLVNARKSSITLVDANKAFNDQGNRQKCAGWRSSIDENNWAAYQILAVTVGDLQFARTANVNADADVSAKLAELEPEVKARLKREFRANFEGQGLVVSFLPLRR